MSMTVSVRCGPVDARRAGGQRRHDLRAKGHVPDYVAEERTKDNSVIIEPPDIGMLRKEIEASRKAAGQQRLRVDARVAVSGIITWGREAQGIIEALPAAVQDSLYRRVAERIGKETGHELIGLVVHRDEYAPHAHFMLRGYRHDEQGRELPWRHGKEMMSRLQDIAGEVVDELGISRGTPKEERIARGEPLHKVVHRTVAELHYDLPREAAAERERLQKELEEQRERLEKNQRLIEEQNEKLEAGRVTEEKAQKRIDTYKKREEDAKRKIAELEKALSDAESSSPPPLPEAETFKVKNGLFSSSEVQAVTIDKLGEFVNKVKLWAANYAERKTKEIVEAVQKRSKMLDAQEDGLEASASALIRRESELKAREKRLDDVLAENKALRDRELSVSLNLGRMLGVENSSMNRGKVLRAVARTGDFDEFRRLLAAERVPVHGPGQKRQERNQDYDLSR